METSGKTGKKNELIKEIVVEINKHNLITRKAIRNYLKNCTSVAIERDDKETRIICFDVFGKNQIISNPNKDKGLPAVKEELTADDLVCIIKQIR